jgi:hypothetical protein
MPDEGARVELTRSGGFAGLRRTAQLELDADEAEALAVALEATDDDPEPAAGADRFQYDLTLVRGEQRRSVRVRDGAVPDALRPVLDRLRQRLG